jgi:hypothetical protein
MRALVLVASDAHALCVKSTRIVYICLAYSQRCLSGTHAVKHRYYVSGINDIITVYPVPITIDEAMQ